MHSLDGFQPSTNASCSAFEILAEEEETCRNAWTQGNTIVLSSVAIRLIFRFLTFIAPGWKVGDVTRYRLSDILPVPRLGA